ncbi:MAG: thioredoxin [Bacteroidales bacterium]
MSTTLVIFISLAAFTGYLVFNYIRMRRVQMVPDHEKIITLTDNNFNYQIKNGVHLVDFWAAWCVPCKMMGPILNELAEQSDGSYKVGKLNVEQHPEMASNYGVRNIPTMIIFKNGKEFKRIVGVKTKEYLLKQIRELK